MTLLFHGQNCLASQYYKACMLPKEFGNSLSLGMNNGHDDNFDPVLKKNHIKQEILGKWKNLH